MSISPYALRLILLLCGAAFAASPQARDLFKSVTPDGKVVYSDHPPAENRIVKTLSFENLPSSTLPDAVSSSVEKLRKQKASSLGTAPVRGVVLFSAVWCGYCKQAKAYLAGKGIAYQEIDIDTDEGKAAFARVEGGSGVPLLLADGQRVQGFSSAAYDQLFARK